MHFYVIYDKTTGKILQTHVKYILGNEEPVACTEEEVLSAAVEDLEPYFELAISRVPDGFDPRIRNKRLIIDKKTGLVKVSALSRRLDWEEKNKGKGGK